MHGLGQDVFTYNNNANPFRMTILFFYREIYALYLAKLCYITL